MCDSLTIFLIDEVFSKVIIRDVMSHVVLFLYPINSNILKKCGYKNSSKEVILLYQVIFAMQ